jgi:hypothetical protein
MEMCPETLKANIFPFRYLVNENRMASLMTESFEIDNFPHDMGKQVL